MLPILPALLSALHQTISFSETKEIVKRITGLAAFVFGCLEIASEVDRFYIEPLPQNQTDRWILIAAKISIIFTALSSPIGVHLCGMIGSVIMGSTPFDPNITFAVDPLHPRHILSIAGALLGLPAIIKAIADAIFGRQMPQLQLADRWITDRQMQGMVIFNTLFGRPALHIGNAFYHQFIRP